MPAQPGVAGRPRSAATAGRRSLCKIFVKPRGGTFARPAPCLIWNNVDAYLRSALGFVSALRVQPAAVHKANAPARKKIQVDFNLNVIYLYESSTTRIRDLFTPLTVYRNR